jgi:hypothetical protein
LLIRIPLKEFIIQLSLNKAYPDEPDKHLTHTFSADFTLKSAEKELQVWVLAS